MLLPVVLTLGPMSKLAVAAPDWAKVDKQKLTLFYPGQASWEWLLTTHSAAKSVRKGTNCRECHADEEKDIGNLIVSGKKLENKPISGKPGFQDVEVSFSRDDKMLYVLLAWDDPDFHSGKKMDADFESRVAVMFDDGKVKEAIVAGCWGFCHADATGMPSNEGDKKRSLYLAASRKKLKRKGGGDDFKSADEINQLREDKTFIEYWQARLKEDGQADVLGGYILDKRHELKNSGVAVNAKRNGKRWTVQFSRPLKAAQAGQKDFADGEYIVGFALHDDFVKGRFHYVSLGYTLALGGGRADFVVSK